MAADRFSDRILQQGLEHVGALADADPLVRGEEVEGQYVIEERIGSGGFGHVYKARDLRAVRRPVALKVLRPELLRHSDSARILSLFTKEAVTAMHLQHPNIVVVHARGNQPFADSTLPFMVMEFLQGMTLAEHLRHAAPLDPSEAVLLTQQILSALAYAHSQEVLHLDIKPGNIIVRDEQIKLLDFGLARLGQGTALFPILPDSERGDVEAVLYQRLSRGGTFGYLPLEQRFSADRSVATDLWATAIVLWQMLTGYLPEDLGAPSSPLDGQPDEEPPWNRWIEESLPEMISGTPALRQILRRALDQRPAARFPSAKEFQMALMRAEAHRNLGDAVSPYYHIAPFGEDNAAVFFGRERVTVQLKKHLRYAPFFTVLGISGAGKSSLVRAGLVPQLRAEGWSVICMTPGDAPLERLARLVLARRLAPVARDSLVALPDRKQLPDIISAALHDWAQEDGQHTLLFIDQFEELFTRSDSRERREFCDLLSSLADDARNPFRVLITLRDDYRPCLADIPGLARITASHHLYLDPPDEEELRDALERPASLAGFRYEPVLLMRVLAALRNENPPLPLLQLIAARLWHERNPSKGILPARAFEEGGLVQVLTGHADGVISRLTDGHQRQLAKTVLCQLVTEQGMRREVALKDLMASAGEALLTTLVIRQLEQERLVSIKEQNGEAMVQLSHDILTSWPQLVIWLAEAPEWNSLRTRLQAVAAQWEGAGKLDALLWTGQRLQDLRKGCREYSPSWNPIEQDFIAASVRRQRWRYFGVISIFASLVILAVILGWLWRLAEQGQREAVRSAERERAAANRERETAAREKRSREETELARRAADKNRQLAEQNRQLAVANGKITDRALIQARQSEQRALESARAKDAALHAVKQALGRNEQLTLENTRARRRTDIESAANLLAEDPKGSLQIIVNVLGDAPSSATDEERRILYQSIIQELKRPGRQGKIFLERCPAGIGSAEWGASGGLLVVCDAQSATLRMPGERSEITEFAPGEKGALVGTTLWTSDGVRLWRWLGRPLVRQALPVALGNGQLLSLHAALSERYMVLRFKNPGRVSVLDTQRGAIVFSADDGTHAVLTSDGSSLVVGNQRGEARVHDLRAEQRSTIQVCTTRVKALASHPRTHRLLVGCEGDAGDDLREATLDGRTIWGRSWDVCRLLDVSYSPDGSLVLVHSICKNPDSAKWTWEAAVHRYAANTALPVVPLARFDNIRRASFSPDGRWLLIGDEESLWLLPLEMDAAIATAKHLLIGQLPPWPWTARSSRP